MKKIVDIFEENYIIFLVYAFLGWIYEVVWIYLISGMLENRGFLFGPFLPVYGFGMLLLVILLRKFLSKKHYFGSVYGLLSVLFFVNFIFIMVIEYTHARIYNVIEFISKYGLLELFITIIGIVIYYIGVNIGKKKININGLLVFILIFIIATVVEYIAHFCLDKISGIMLWDYSKDFLNINKRICFDASRNFAILGTFAIYVIQPMIDRFNKNINKKTRHIIVLVILIPMLIDWLIHTLR